MGFMDIFTPNSKDNIVDAIINTGDALVYTDEEKAQALQLAVDTKLKMLPLYEPFKLAQRYLAFAFTANFILSFWIGVILFLFFPLYLDGFINLVTMFNLGWIMFAIVSFYFSGGFIESFKLKSSK